MNPFCGIESGPYLGLLRAERHRLFGALGPDAPALHLGFRVSGFGFRVSGLGFRISGFGSWVSGFGFRASGFGLLVSGFGSREGQLE